MRAPRPAAFVPLPFLVTLLAWNGFSRDIGEYAGTAEFQYLEILVQARPAALAGAFTAVAEGPEAVGYNPAGLGRSEASRVAASMRYHWLGVTSGNVTYAYPGAGGLRYAVSGAYVNYGSIEEMDEWGKTTGNALMPSSFNPSFSIAGRYSDRIHLGATVKGLQEYLGDFEESQFAFGWGMDVGLLYQPGRRNLGLGLSLLNLGRKERAHTIGGGSGGLLPGSVKAGLFYYLANRAQTRLTVDVEVPWHDLPLLSAGLEHQFSPYLVGRAGTRVDYAEARHYLLKAADQDPGEFRGGNALKLAGGLGILLDDLALDYAVQFWNGASWVHVLAVRVAVK